MLSQLIAQFRMLKVLRHAGALAKHDPTRVMLAVAFDVEYVLIRSNHLDPSGERSAVALLFCTDLLSRVLDSKIGRRFEGRAAVPVWSSSSTQDVLSGGIVPTCRAVLP